MSTKRELLDAAKTLGIKGVNMNSRLEEIRSEINKVLGTPDLPNDQPEEVTDSVAATLNVHGIESVAKLSGAVTAGSANIPNLSPTGVWQGKRARVRRVKTGHNDMGGAIFMWNGWPTIVPIDKDVDVAWPIFEIIKNCVGMQMEITQEEDMKEKGRVHNHKNITYYDKYPFQFKGVTPGTETLPESPWEYTLDMYVEDFPDYSVRKWRQLSILWELSDVLCAVKPGMDPEEEIKKRRNAIHYALNLPQNTDRAGRERIRDQKRNDIGMEAKAA